MKFTRNLILLKTHPLYTLKQSQQKPTGATALAVLELVASVAVADWALGGSLALAIAALQFAGLVWDNHFFYLI